MEMKEIWREASHFWLRHHAQNCRENRSSRKDGWNLYKRLKTAQQDKHLKWPVNNCLVVELAGDSLRAKESPFGEQDLGHYQDRNVAENMVND
jgi:hypothetical protein